MFLLMMIFACDVSESSKMVTEQVVGKTIEATKGTAQGIKSGIESGRKSAKSADGSIVLSTKEEIFTRAQITLWQINEAKSGAVEVVLAIENTSEDSLHLIGLSAEGGALLIDNEGFATTIHPLSEGQLGQAIKVPPNAKIKQSLYFKGNAAQVKNVRLWGTDISK